MAVVRYPVFPTGPTSPKHYKYLNELNLYEFKKALLKMTETCLDPGHTGSLENIKKLIKADIFTSDGQSHMPNFTENSKLENSKLYKGQRAYVCGSFVVNQEKSWSDIQNMFLTTEMCYAMSYTKKNDKTVLSAIKTYGCSDDNNISTNIISNTNTNKINFNNKHVTNWLYNDQKGMWVPSCCSCYRIFIMFFKTYIF